MAEATSDAAVAASLSVLVALEDNQLSSAPPSSASTESSSASASLASTPLRSLPFTLQAVGALGLTDVLSTAQLKRVNGDHEKEGEKDAEKDDDEHRGDLLSEKRTLSAPLPNTAPSALSQLSAYFSLDPSRSVCVSCVLD
jgi:hypothetical protein